MAEFSFIRYYKVYTLTSGYTECYDKELTSYINNNFVSSFNESSSGMESSIKMADGTVYYFHKSLADLMSEFGKIQYTV